MRDKEEKLDRLLRNVEVPEDLKTSLRRIPYEATQSPLSVEISGDHNWISRRAIGLLVLAAALVGVSLFFVNPFRNEREQVAGKASDEKLVTPDESELQNGSAPTAANLLEQMSANSLELHAFLVHQNIELLEALLAEQQSPQPVISQMELASVAMSVANQAGVDYGNDIGSVREDLQQVITDYPGTAGAHMSRSFIEQSKHNSEF